MHPAISHFPNAEFYANQIEDGITEDDRPTQPFGLFPVRNLPLVFASLQGAEGGGSSF
jgi:superfamily I DNA and/or RNA helicase